MRSTKLFLSIAAVAALLTLTSAASAQNCSPDERAQFAAAVESGDSAENLAADFGHCDGDPTLDTPEGIEPVPAGDTSYEEMNSCGYHPQGELVFCDVEVKQPTGYNGLPPLGGSNEYVRFCFDCDNDLVWEDSTLGIVHVTDDASGGTLPFFFNAYASTNEFCPQNDGLAFRIRAVLAWAQPLDHTVCDNPEMVIWGNALEFETRRDP